MNMHFLLGCCLLLLLLLLLLIVVERGGVAVTVFRRAGIGLI